MDKYRSVPMDTAMEIRNFPVGTMAFSDSVGDSRKVAVKVDDSRWARTDSDLFAADSEMIGWTALERIDNGFIL